MNLVPVTFPQGVVLDHGVLEHEGRGGPVPALVGRYDAAPLLHEGEGGVDLAVRRVRALV